MKFLTGENVSIILFFMGLAGMIRSRRILKTIISFGIMEVGTILFFLTMYASPEGTAPIKVNTFNAVDPLPQALMITAIVIGVAVTALTLVMFIHLYHMYGTSNWEEMKKIRMEKLK